MDVVSDVFACETCSNAASPSVQLNDGTVVVLERPAKPYRPFMSNMRCPVCGSGEAGTRNHFFVTKLLVVEDSVFFPTRR
jgi:hypothetical protein